MVTNAFPLAMLVVANFLKLGIVRDVKPPMLANFPGKLPVDISGCNDLNYDPT